MERPPRQRRNETPVVPLHAHRPPQAMRTVGGLALAEPAVAPEPSPAAAPPRQPATPGAVRGARARRATKERLAHDGWTFVVVPPGLDARPRTLHVSVRRFRVFAMGLATIAGTAVVCGMLLAVMLSVAPTVQDESAGVALGLFGSEPAAPQTFVPAPEEMDLISLLAIGPAAATVATPEPAPATAKDNAATAERPVGPRTSAARRTVSTERRRVLAPPSVSGARESRVRTAAMAEGMPVIGRITSQFSNSRRHPVLGVVRPHRGIDIAASTGTPIMAPAGGRVVFSGRKFGFGNVVEIDHGHGIITRYAHCRTLKVKRGEQVETGETIATVGRTGLASGPHLHFEVLLDGRSVDPMKNRVETLILDRSPARAQPAATANIFVPGLPVTPIAAPVASTTDSAAGATAQEDAGEAGEANARSERE